MYSRYTALEKLIEHSQTSVHENNVKQETLELCVITSHEKGRSDFLIPETT